MRTFFAMAGLCVCAASSVQAQVIDANLLAEAKTSMAKGDAFIMSKQADDGAWMKDPAMTALCVMALQLEKNKTEAVSKAVEKGRQFILRSAKPDGAIYGVVAQYVNYSTAVCLCALAAIGNADDKEVIRKGRRFIMDSQLDDDNKTHPTKPDNPFYGGIGYGSAGPDRPDLSNTQWALEALNATASVESGDGADLAFKKALSFLSNVQNVPKDAGQSWVVDLKKDPKSDGGFYYKADESKATEKLKKEGAQDADVEGLRSYGSMTYAGLKSMIYAKMDKSDVRVKAARDWASKHYTLDENPVMGPEGHFYYLHTFAKSNRAFGENFIKLADGKTVDWRIDLLRKCVALQGADGSWVNAKSGRWMESVPELVTAYSLMAMRTALAE